MWSSFKRLTFLVTSVELLAGLSSPFGFTADLEEARTLLRESKWAESAVILRELHRKNSESSEVAADLSRALTQLGRREEAVQTLISAAQQAPAARRRLLLKRADIISKMFFSTPSLQLYQDGVNLLKSGKRPLARLKLEQALDQEKDNVSILVRLGQCQILDNSFDLAAETLIKAKRLNPMEPRINLWLGRALHQRGEINEALLHFKGLPDVLPEQEISHAWYAEALFSSGQKNQGIQTLLDDIRVRPDHLLSLITLAKLKLQGSRTDKATLWDARKDLQLALSRLTEYEKTKNAFETSELDLSLRNPQTLQQEAEDLLARIETQLSSLSEKTSEE